MNAQIIHVSVMARKTLRETWLKKFEKIIINSINILQLITLITMSKLDISVTLKNYKPHDDIRRGRIELICSGKDCNDQFINAIGRIAVKRIPVYAFAKELIKIERINPETGYHDSVPFNHDMMRDRIKNTPVMNIDTGFAYLHERYWKNVDYLNENREKHPDEKRIEVYVDEKNTASDEDIDTVKHVTTNDMKVYIDDTLTKMYSTEYPLLLISLRPKEAFKCSARAVLGVGINDTCWDACSNYWYDQETIPDKTILSFESSSRFDEFVLVSRSLEYFKTRTMMLKDEIHRMYLLEEKNDPSDVFEITIKDEDHTMGEAINYEIQSHPSILKSSHKRPDFLVRHIVIEVVAFKKDKMLDGIMESFDNLVTKIDKFETEFNKIARPQIKADKSEEKKEPKEVKEIKESKEIKKEEKKKTKSKGK